MPTFICRWTDPPHEHSYPADWIFGGPYRTDPRADPRWESTLYIYYDRDTTEVFRTVSPLCDDEALDLFTALSHMQGADPVWLMVRRPNGTEEMLPWTYDKTTDFLTPTGGFDSGRG